MIPAPLRPEAPLEPTPSQRDAVRLDGVGVALGDHDALVGVDLHLPAGRLTALVGPNGAGKSTLIEVVAGTRAPTRGRVHREARAVALVPQRAAVSDRLPVTVHEVVTVGAWGEAGLWRRVGADGRRRVRDAMELLGLTPLARRPYGVLSGGERQRALLAQGLARGADLLLLDEPTTGLDAASAGVIRTAVRSEVDRGVTVLCVSHDPAVIDTADHLVRLEAGRVVSTSEPG